MDATITIRAAQPEPDGHAIVDLINTFEEVPVSYQQFLDWDAFQAEGRICRRTVAVDCAGQVIGYGQSSHEAWYPPGRFYLWVVTAKPARGQGVGTALFNDALSFAEGRGAQSYQSEVRDNDEIAMRFAAQRGFVVNRHLYESELDLPGFDETPFVGVIAALQAEGIRFYSMAEAGDTQAERRKLHAVNRETAFDIPGWAGDWMNFEDFEKLVCGSVWYRPAGQIVAADGDQVIGLSAVRILQDEGMSYNLMTGVLRPYRGRGIATALKLLAIRYARGEGMKTMRTDNDSLNGPMLAVNRKLGYRPLPGRFLLKNGE